MTFNYIGSGPASTPECMHGPDECAGDRQQLCAQKHLSASAFLDFVQCQDQSLELIPQNGQSCAKGDWSTVSECADGAEGEKLLVDSVGVSNKTGIRCVRRSPPRGVSCPALTLRRTACRAPST